jgi:DNA repair photolyase
MRKRVLYHDKPGPSLRPQKNINPYSLPFTLNPCIGCLFGCSYCYVQWSSFKHTVFGEEVKVKTWLPQGLKKDLRKYEGLPQHLKRVQINSNCEYYVPQVMIKTKRDLGKDIMQQLLENFQHQWDTGNPWMVHIFTKSHLVVRHLGLLTEMKQQVQVELTIPTLDEGMRREFEGSAPSVKRRLKTVEQLSRAGIFVRVMAMPLFRREEAEKIRHIGFEHGARGFQHRGPHYWGGASIVGGKAIKPTGRQYPVFWDLLAKGGEHVLEKGRPKTVTMLMPNHKWRQFEKKDLAVENAGYSELNDIDWGYII